MSYILFSDDQESVEVSGTERAHMGNLLDRLFCAAFGLDWFDGRKAMWEILPPGVSVVTSIKDETPPPDFHSLHVGKRMADWIAVGPHEKAFLLPNCVAASVFHCILNTALVIGSNPLALYARIHGQCEPHLFIEGENRRWVAGIIRDGLETHIYRAAFSERGQRGGWRGLVDFLEADSTRPVVASYSVMDGFPSWRAAGWQEAREDDWYALSLAEQWRIGMAVLREPSRGLELKPVGWREPSYFGEHSAFTILSLLDRHERSVAK